MKILTVRCNECGTPLEIADITNYVTCFNCGTQLSLVRNGEAVSTESLSATGSPEQVRLQNELVLLDRAWEFDRRKCLVRLKRGYHQPGFSVFSIWIVFALIGLGCIFDSGNPKSGAFGLLFGVLIASFSITRLVEAFQKAGRLKSGRALYESRRRTLRAALDRTT